MYTIITKNRVGKEKNEVTSWSFGHWQNNVLHE